MKEEKQPKQFVSVTQIQPRWRLIGLLLLWVSLACRAAPFGFSGSQATLPPESTQLATQQTAGVPSWATAAPAATSAAATPSQPPSAASPTASFTKTGYEVYLHPDGGLYVGDQVSFEVLSAFPQDVQVQVVVALPTPLTLGPVNFNLYGIEGRRQATLIWGWDTRGLAAGLYAMTFTTYARDGSLSQQWEMTVDLLPADQAPPPEPEAQWAEARSDCCVIYYITGTDAARDIHLIRSAADEQARSVSQAMGAEFTSPVTITLLSRVLGHGGFASDEIHISYLDENYAASLGMSGAFAIIAHHEMVHVLDGRLGGDFRPSLFVEGLAVYLTGGHFKPEPLLARAAALLDLDARQGGWYLPLRDLADNFYASQHEIGYLEGGALTAYMVERWGWDTFSRFYRGMHPPEQGSHADAIEAGLQEHLGISFTQLEVDFRAYLQTVPFTPEEQDDLRLTVAFYNAVRRYQKAYDPSAYFATAWLLDTAQMRQRGIVADYLRRPRLPENIQAEENLLQASQFLRLGLYSLAEALLEDTPLPSLNGAD